MQSSYVNESGTLLLLALAPTADPRQVAAEVSRQLGQHFPDRIADRLVGRNAETALAVTALQHEQWLDERRVAQRTVLGASVPESAGGASVRESAAAGRPARGVSWAVLLACLAVGLWLLGRRFAPGRRAPGVPDPSRLWRRSL